MRPQRTLDFNKVSWAEYWYENQFGERSSHLLDNTVHLVAFDKEAIAPAHPSYPHETMLERARRLGILDVFTPCCKLVISANRELFYRGNKAKQMWQTYNKHIYGPK